MIDISHRKEVIEVKTKKINDNLYEIIHKNETVGRVEITKLTGRVYGDRRMRNVYFGEKKLGVADNLKEALEWVREELNN